MVTRRRLLAVSLASALLVAAGAGSADAWNGNPAPTPPTNPSPPTNPTTGSQSGAGTPGTTQVRNCFLYASASSFGLTCISGGVGGHARSVKAILGDQVGDVLCWDTQISAAELDSRYGIVADPAVGIPSYVHTCITGLDPNRSLYDQATAQINQTVYEIAKPCDTPPPYKVDAAGQCVMTLTDRQRQVADALQSRGGQIPGVVLTREPNAQVRTNQEVTYVDAPLNADGTSVTRTSDYSAQGVTLYATRTAFTIFPYGPGGAARPCSGASARAGTSPAGSCVWAYPRSSADQPGQTYPFRAEADWTVWIDDGTGPRAWKSFQKFDDVQVPVYDVQTLVVGG